VSLSLLLEQLHDEGVNPTSSSAQPQVDDVLLDRPADDSPSDNCEDAGYSAGFIAI